MIFNLQNIKQGDTQIQYVYQGNNLLWRYQVPEIPLDEIWYTSDPKHTISLPSGDFGGATAISVTYTGDTGVIKFDRNLETIGNNAFYQNVYFKTLSLPDDITSIGTGAFYGNTSLNTIKLPKNLISIGNQAFWRSNELLKIELPPYVTTIGREAFRECSNLREITFNEVINSIGGQAFYQCNISSFTVPETVSVISQGLMEYNRNLSTFIINTGVTKIELAVFNYCSALTDITYLGTKQQWNNININSLWTLGSSVSVVHCTDGDISVPPWA